MRQHEAHRADQVGRGTQQQLTFRERLPHQAERVMLQITQAAVDQLGGSRRGATGQIALLEQENGKATACRVAGNPAAVDAAADDREVEQGSVCRVIQTCGGSAPVITLHSWVNSPDLPPALCVNRSASIRMPRSTDLHMS